MDSKKNLWIIGAVIILAIIIILGWGGIGNKTGSDSTIPANGNLITTDTTIGTDEQATGGSIGNMTDDIFVEMIAQAAYYGQKNPAGWAAYEQTLLQKYGITEENLAAYGDLLENDPQRAQAITEKYVQRLTELQMIEE